MSSKRLDLPYSVISPVLTETEYEAFKEMFDRITDYLEEKTFNGMQGKYITITTTKAETGYLIPHGLTYIPTVYLELYHTEGVTVTWHPDSFDLNNINLDTDGACTIRAFIGRYSEA